MLVRRHHVGQRFGVHIITMGNKFNSLVLGFGFWLGLWPSISMAQPTHPLPLILPEPTFQTLPRITGNLINQRMMDSHSIIRVRYTNPAQALPPGTPVIVFRQGLQLKGSDGKALGILAIPVAQGQTLNQATLDQEIAQPADKSSGWFRVSALRQEVMRGDSLMTRAEAMTHQPARCKRSEPPNDGVLPPVKIIALAGQTDMMATGGGLVIVSGGCQNGLHTGDPLTIWRNEVTQFGRRLDQAVENPQNNAYKVFEDNPDITRELSSAHRVGNGTIVASYPSVAIVQIHQLSQAIQLGDLIRPAPKNPVQPSNHELIVPKK
jgi:hypothetical protein